MELKGKCALITGAEKGIGREIALGLARQGVNIAVHYNKSKELASELVLKIEELGVSAVKLDLDLTKIKKLGHLVEDVVKAFGGLHILINNAAVFSLSKFGETTEDEWDNTLKVNLTAGYFLVQAARPYLEEANPGKVINIADVYAYSPAADFMPYGISKAGVVALTRGLAKALAPNVHVNCICPGAIDRGEGEAKISFQKVVDRTPMKRAGSPQDVVDAVLYLLLTDYVTGEEICVDGGRHLI